jgi:hypothetical protein
LKFCLPWSWRSEWMTGPCTATVSDLLCIPHCFSPSTVLHFERNIVSYIKGHLGSHLTPSSSLSLYDGFMWSVLAFFLHWTTLTVTQIIWPKMIWWLMVNELEEMWKKAWEKQLKAQSRKRVNPLRFYPVTVRIQVRTFCSWANLLTDLLLLKIIVSDLYTNIVLDIFVISGILHIHYISGVAIIPVFTWLVAVILSRSYYLF